ncbi:MAG TPA: SUMF1/EgtB/PvdO family nonheme iron enzyme [Kofleriaceae bacterium]|nr:SUMF1/EgtB/PvdO family nonheme iron enzyme [Kofleriaceae bacterium]
MWQCPVEHVGLAVPSCAGSPRTQAASCGASGGDDCCASLLVSAGTYDRGFDLAGDSLSGDMTSPATVSNFRLDRYEVTVARFRAFVEAGRGAKAMAPAVGSGAHPKLAGSGWQAAWNDNLASDTAALEAGRRQR